MCIENSLGNITLMLGCKGLRLFLIVIGFDVSEVQYIKFIFTTIFWDPLFTFHPIKIHLLPFICISQEMNDFVMVFLLVYSKQSSKEVLSSVKGTGIAMLFSAGTFLYVATVHVLPELMSMNTHCDSSSDQGRSDKMQRTDLFLMVFGIVSPLLLSQTHSHH